MQKGVSTQNLYMVLFCHDEADGPILILILVV